MNDHPQLPTVRDKLLFTPGPLTTSLSVKQAMIHDAGSWHFEFNTVVQRVRESLLKLAELTAADGFEAILMQGSGTFGVESVIASVIPPQGRLLILANGAYGERIAKIATCLRIDYRVLRSEEDTVPVAQQAENLLLEDPAITHVAMVHCETTTGILNPLEPIGQIVQRYQRSFIVDAMSSFGAIPLDPRTMGIDYLVSSANKCLEGVPGFSFIIARRTALQATTGYARSLSLDLLGQLQGFEANGQFRFTPQLMRSLPLIARCENWSKRAGLPRGDFAMPPITGHSWPECTVLDSYRFSIPRSRASSSRHSIHPQIQHSGSPSFTTVSVTVV